MNLKKAGIFSHRARRAQPPAGARIAATGTAELRCIAALQAEGQPPDAALAQELVQAQTLPHGPAAAGGTGRAGAAAPGDGQRRSGAPVHAGATRSATRCWSSSASICCCTSACAWSSMSRHSRLCPRCGALRRWWLVHLGEPEFAFMFDPPRRANGGAGLRETTGLNPRTDEIAHRRGAHRGRAYPDQRPPELLAYPEKGVSAGSVRDPPPARARLSRRYPARRGHAPAHALHRQPPAGGLLLEFGGLRPLFGRCWAWACRSARSRSRPRTTTTSSASCRPASSRPMLTSTPGFSTLMRDPVAA